MTGYPITSLLLPVGICHWYTYTFKTILSSNLKPTTHECVHLVTRGHFWSRDKDGGHIIRSAIAENLTLHANFVSMFYRTRVIADRILTLRDWEYWLPTFFAPVTLTLTRWPLYTNLTRIWIYKYELHASRLSKVIVWQTDRQTRQKCCFAGGHLTWMDHPAVVHLMVWLSLSNAIRI